MSLSLSQWYPGSGVVLDCIDSVFYTLCYLEVNKLLLKKGSRKNLSGISRLVLKNILGTKKNGKLSLT